VRYGVRMFTAYLAFVVLGAVALVLMPESSTARALKYVIYALILAGLLFFAALVYGQYASHASL